MKHLFFVQTTKGIWVPGGLYENKADAIDDAARLNVQRGVLVRVPMGMKAHWREPERRDEIALAD